MFNNKIKQTNPVAISNIIGQGSHLEGNIQTTGNLRIEGKVTGGIKAKAKVVLSHTAQIEGNIVAQNAEIGGEVKGSIEVIELLVLKSTAMVWGDIVTSKLVFEEGACFDGKCKMGKEHKPPPLAASTKAPLSSKTGESIKNHPEKLKSSNPSNPFIK
ncbi:bactofilin family protein [Cardinium endosymbiont of Bemisia tabaci]|uniref:bactofilin family protein n=1 Tax=Cardinium endosymbiont of Bemisia tabaci TaxID=672794 RepID=UPI000442D0BB|nr:polymer-forming cytoskeletal protein [Cardinium endosymbiont of Bemisia tabaci]CDG49359.1 Bactofilin family protein [Cardinium endosymbiont cBtQ1 of Bemisia tabaci]